MATASPKAATPAVTTSEPYSIDISTDFLIEAEELHLQEDIYDGDDSRSDARKAKNSRIGKLGEVAAYHFFASQGVPVSYYDAWDGDLRLGGGGLLDVKVRDHAETFGEDLLVRDRPDVPLQADGYLHMIIPADRSAAEIIGWAHVTEVKSAPWFQKAQTHPTRIIQRDDLRPVSDLLSLFR